ncbi:MAG TPA: NAD(P)-dependent oxidoreductase [Acidobacteriaceae bacterium]|jgi:3-hydroxyisobutyrate dehydrogenase|nr:NAD(P)-dependent oxidoreductase [Acidobacteriaceae bacterium]
METTLKVALLGLGTMGHGMGLNLLKAGFPLTVYNRTRARAEALAAAGATVAETPAEAVEDATVVVAMLADDEASRTAWLGPEGALAAMEQGSVVVECSTLSPDWVAELNEAARKRGMVMVEAPVTGSRAQAEAGQLNFLAGADEETLAMVTPVLRSMSRAILHLGPVGSGAQLKLINNFLCAAQVASFAEALAWIERTGLRREAALEFLKKGAPGSGIVSTMADRMTQRTYEVNFLLRLMAKDVRYAHAAAAQRGIELSMAGPVEGMFQKAEQQGYGEKDMSAVVEVVRRDQSQ